MFVFNFHHVEPTPLHMDRQHITITPDGLRRLIRIVRLLGFETVSLKDVLKVGGPDNLSPQSLVLTFDDGFENFYQYALPVLEEEQCPATVFVLAGRFSGTNEWDQAHLPESERDALMSLAQIQEIGRSPWVTIGSHGLYHRNMATLTKEDNEEVLFKSFVILAEALGEAFIPVFAYPYGSYAPHVLDVIKQTPYRFALTTKKGQWLSSEQPFEVPRYSVFFRDGNPMVFLAKLIRNRIPIYALEQGLSLKGLVQLSQTALF